MTPAAIITILEWTCSLSTILTFWLMGNRRLLGPIVGLASQFVWLGYVLAANAWGLLPAVGLIALVHVRNIIKWRQGWFPVTIQYQRERERGGFPPLEENPND